LRLIFPHQLNSFIEASSSEYQRHTSTRQRDDKDGILGVFDGFSPLQVRVDDVKNHWTNWKSTFVMVETTTKSRQVHDEAGDDTLNWQFNLLHDPYQFSFPAWKQCVEREEEKEIWKLGLYTKSSNSIFCADDSRWWSEKGNCLKFNIEHALVVNFPSTYINLITF
jgi:hypothetical protein